MSAIDVPGATAFHYAYDANKNPVSQSSLDPDDAQSYAYDAEDRLTSFTRANGDAQRWDLSLAGDWSQVTRNGVTESRTHDAAHALTSFDGSPVPHDEKGNTLVSELGDDLTWDFENRLESAYVERYRYDALGRRVATAKGKAGNTSFVYDGWRVIAEYEAFGPSPAVARTYVFGEHLDEVLMMWDGNRYYVHANRLRSVQALTDDTGALVEAFRYEPYGALTVLTDPGPDGQWFTGDEPADVESWVGMPYAFTGQRLDAMTGLYHYKSRYYSSWFGRFLSRDPIGYEGGTPNLYEYVGSRPVGAVDPMGTDDDNFVGTQQQNQGKHCGQMTADNCLFIDEVIKACPQHCSGAPQGEKVPDEAWKSPQSQQPPKGKVAQKSAKNAKPDLPLLLMLMGPAVIALSRLGKRVVRRRGS
ncbi:MAG: RHS repeat-associated core domain-containing protein [Minicystis sp.]